MGDGKRIRFGEDLWVCFKENYKLIMNLVIALKEKGLHVSIRSLILVFLQSGDMNEIKQPSWVLEVNVWCCVNIISQELGVVMLG